MGSQLSPLVRHKKCDRGRPACERCTAGGFECLGYGHNDQTAPRLILVDSARESIRQEAPERGSSNPLYQSLPLQAPDDIHAATQDSLMVRCPFTVSSLEVRRTRVLEDMTYQTSFSSFWKGLPYDPWHFCVQYSRHPHYAISRQIRRTYTQRRQGQLDKTQHPVAYRFSPVTASLSSSFFTPNLPASTPLCFNTWGV